MAAARISAGQQATCTSSGKLNESTGLEISRANASPTEMASIEKLHKQYLRAMSQGKEFQLS
ncbi:MAG TPA: hypothetical protein VFV28_09990, partial [Limnobacter sp.]|nr:hypothetical protein [Limnobacter sp.]